MDISKLSWMYYHACNRMHDVIDDLYEELHDNKGEPLELKAHVDEAMEGVKMALYQELDLITASVAEHEGR